MWNKKKEKVEENFVIGQIYFITLFGINLYQLCSFAIEVW